MAFVVPVTPAYTGGGHNREWYCGRDGRDSCSVTRDADSGSRGADSSSSNASSGISGNGGGQLWYLIEIPEKFDADTSLKTYKNCRCFPYSGGQLACHTIGFQKLN